jgi:hypothetical protein
MTEDFVLLECVPRSSERLRAYQRVANVNEAQTERRRATQ